MKRFMLFLSIVAVSLTLTGCFDIPFGNSLEGNWVLTKHVETTLRPDTSFIYEDEYKPEIDRYYSAEIVSLNDDVLIIYNNDLYDRIYATTLDYTSDTLYTFSYTEDTLYFVDTRGWNDTTAVGYYFSKDKELVWVMENDSDYVYEAYFQKYKGDLPPETWVGSIEDDDYEPDNDIANASHIRLDIVQEHTITENDSDYYHISARAGKTYLLEGLAYFEMEMSLLDRDSSLLVYDRDNDRYIKNLGDEVETVIAWTCDVTDDYYILIDAENRFPWNDYEGYYQMLVMEVDSNDIEYDDPWIIWEKNHKKGTGIIKKFLNN